MIMLADELRWLTRTSPVARHYGERLRKTKPQASQRVAFWTAIVPNAVPLIEPVIASCARVFVGPSHRTSTDRRVTEHLRKLGAEVHGCPDMSGADYDAALNRLTAFSPDIVVSTGGDAIRACAAMERSPLFCLEGTRTGMNRLDGLNLRCPVWDWNGLALKDRIEHRYHVADGIWPAFFALTGLSLALRTVVVIGFGRVGEGIAARARSLGARTIVVEPSLLRRTEAGFAGHETAELHDALVRAEIVVTATGRDHVVAEEEWGVCRNGVVFCNAGHSSLEIDVPGLVEMGGRETLKPGITLHRPAGRDVLLLADGGLLNLSTSFGPFANDVWDIFNGIILAGLADLPESEPGIHPYPEHLADEVLRVFLESRTT
jgi:adenosylhomocysteinase